ncbi:uncharacterized protein LOC118438666 isoform X3 [Folsomia candida]|nr:uncharacterized protein LOC118438666 isoform X3 [Folsomia candida]
MYRNNGKTKTKQNNLGSPSSLLENSEEGTTVTPTSFLSNTNNSSTVWGDFEEMPEFFQGVILGCDWIAVGGAVLQILMSCLILCSSSKNTQDRVKYFVGAHFLAFFILVVTLLLPLAYDRENDQFHTMTSFNTEAKKQLWMLQDANVFNFMVTDLRLYYVTLMLDCLGVVIIIVVSSCFLRFSTVSEHEVELFYDRYK